MNVNLGPFLKIPYAVLFQQILTKRDQLTGKSVKPAAVFAQNFAYPEHALYSLNREFKKAQEALTSPLCNRVLEIQTLIFVDRFQNNRGLPCFPRCISAEVETKECHKESRSHWLEAKVHECHPQTRV